MPDSYTNSGFSSTKEKPKKKKQSTGYWGGGAGKLSKPSKQNVFSKEEIQKIHDDAFSKPWEENARKAESIVWRKANPDAPTTMGQWFAKERLPSKEKDPELRRKQQRNLAFLIDMFVPQDVEEGLLGAVGKVFSLFRGQVTKPFGKMIKNVNVPGKGRQLRLTGEGLYAKDEPHTLWTALDMMEARIYPQTADIKSSRMQKEFRKFLGRPLVEGPEGDLLNEELINKFRAGVAGIYEFKSPERFIIGEAQAGRHFGTKKFFDYEPKGHVILPHGIKPGYIRNFYPYDQVMPVGQAKILKSVRDFYASGASLL
tara:strand:- start:335 stop:1273 length:939 start_codon:yes stop_codon:yes gene_type:complete